MYRCGGELSTFSRSSVVHACHVLCLLKKGEAAGVRVETMLSGHFLLMDGMDTFVLHVCVSFTYIPGYSRVSGETQASFRDPGQVFVFVFW